jgi:hypothetical protein
MMKIARISEKSTTFCGRVVAVTMLCIVLNCVTALAAPKIKVHRLCSTALAPLATAKTALPQQLERA